MAAWNISRIRSLVREKRYVVSTHAAEELDDDNLSIFDLESILLTGETAGRQRDRNTTGAKFVIKGQAVAGKAAEAVIKRGATGHVVFITVYAIN